MQKLEKQEVALYNIEIQGEIPYVQGKSDKKMDK